MDYRFLTYKTFIERKILKIIYVINFLWFDRLEKNKYQQI